MAKSNHNINEVGESVAVIMSEVRNLSKNFEDFRNDTKRTSEASEIRLNCVENKVIQTETKVGNLAIFQSIFSIVIGAIATYLGVSVRK